MVIFSQISSCRSIQVKNSRSVERENFGIVQNLAKKLIIYCSNPWFSIKLYGLLKIFSLDKVNSLPLFYRNTIPRNQFSGFSPIGGEKSGYLLKRSEGVRKQWQKRYCVIKEGQFTLAHSTTDDPSVNLNLLTCQVHYLITFRYHSMN